MVHFTHISIYVSMYFRANLPYSKIDELSSLQSIKQRIHILLVTDDKDQKLDTQLQAGLPTIILYY